MHTTAKVAIGAGALLLLWASRKAKAAPQESPAAPQEAKPAAAKLPTTKDMVPLHAAADYSDDDPPLVRLGTLLVQVSDPVNGFVPVRLDDPAAAVYTNMQGETYQPHAPIDGTATWWVAERYLVPG